MATGRVAVVTGSSGGIGRAIAVRLAREGIAIAVASRTDDRYPGTNEETVEMIRGTGGVAEAFETDLSAQADRLGLVARVNEKLGDVDILINNAAVSTFEPVGSFRESRFDLMMSVQVKAPFQLTQQVLPGMKRMGRGWIVNISSPGALHPDAEAGRSSPSGSSGTVYGMCKIALERLSTGTALEVYDEGINVNALAPTHLVPTFGAGAFHWDPSRIDQESPDLTADAVAYLVDERSPRITGRILYTQSFLASLTV